MKAEWTSLPLDAVVERHTVKNALGDTNVLTISARHGLVSQREFFNKQVASKDLGHYFVLERGDFAYNKSYSDGYPVGAIKRLDKYATGVVSPLYICFRLKAAERVCSEFLVQYFEAGLLEPGLRGIAKEGARNHGLLNVKPSEFFALPVRLPPLGEQKKIAAILSSVDKAIEATQAVIDQLQVVKKAMMVELLTRGLPGRHTRFKQTEIGEMPEEWEVAAVGDLATLQQGLQIPISERFKEPGPGRWLYITIKYLSRREDGEPPEYIQSPRKSVTCGPDDLLLARTGGPGKVVTDVTGAFHNNFFRIDYDRQRVDKDYLRLWLESPAVQREIRLRAGTTTIPDLNHGDFLSMRLPLPTLDEQRSMAAPIRAIEERLTCERAEMETLKALKSALAPVLLAGQVRAKPDEDAA